MVDRLPCRGTDARDVDEHGPLDSQTGRSGSLGGHRDVFGLEWIYGGGRAVWPSGG